MRYLSLENELMLLFFSALLLALCLTPLSRTLSFALNVLDRPDERKVHIRTLPCLGGVAIAVSLFLATALLVPMERTFAAFLLGGLIVAVTGLVDDVVTIPPSVKFLGQIAAAAVFVGIGGMSLQSFGDILCVGEICTGRWAFPITVFCMVGVMNALNLSDGLDGLAGGISVIGSLFLGLFAYMGGNWLCLCLLAALLGAVFGFLRYNTYPATLFMGDAGSLLLGYLLSAVAVMMTGRGSEALAVPPVTICIVLALPILDTLFVMLRRLYHRENPFRPDMTHLHHRLMSLGLPHSAVVSILYVSMAAFGFLAWAGCRWPEWTQFASALALGVVIYGTVYFLQHRGYRWEGTSNRTRFSRRTGVHRRASVWLRRSLPILSWAIGIGLVFPALLLGDVPRPVSLGALAMVIFIVVLFPWRARRVRVGICHGLLYVACFGLVAIFHFMPSAPRWLPAYLAVLSAVALLWVLLKLRFRGHARMIRASGFETLLVGTTLFIPLVLVPTMGFGDGVRNMLLVACLEAASLMVAVKVLLGNRPGRNYAITGSLLIALLLIGTKAIV